MGERPHPVVHWGHVTVRLGFELRSAVTCWASTLNLSISGPGAGEITPRDGAQVWGAQGHGRVPALCGIPSTTGGRFRRSSTHPGLALQGLGSLSTVWENSRVPQGSMRLGLRHSAAHLRLNTSDSGPEPPFTGARATAHTLAANLICSRGQLPACCSLGPGKAAMVPNQGSAAAPSQAPAVEMGCGRGASGQVGGGRGGSPRAGSRAKALPLVRTDAERSGRLSSLGVGGFPAPPKGLAVRGLNVVLQLQPEVKGDSGSVPGAGPCGGQDLSGHGHCGGKPGRHPAAYWAVTRQPPLMEVTSKARAGWLNRLPRPKGKDSKPEPSRRWLFTKGVGATIHKPRQGPPRTK